MGGKRSARVVVVVYRQNAAGRAHLAEKSESVCGVLLWLQVLFGLNCVQKDFMLSFRSKNYASRENNLHIF